MSVKSHSVCQHAETSRPLPALSWARKLRRGKVLIEVRERGRGRGREGRCVWLTRQTEENECWIDLWHVAVLHCSLPSSIASLYSIPALTNCKQPFDVSISIPSLHSTNHPYHFPILFTPLIPYVLVFVLSEHFHFWAKKLFQGRTLRFWSCV